MRQQTDIVVIGAGIAGASVAAHLAETRNVVILEMEERPGYHTTGRSAATYEPNYGPPPMLAFTRASHGFFAAPPAGFAESPLIEMRPSLFFEADGQEAHTARFLPACAGVEEISAAQAKSLFPILRGGYAQRVFLDAGTGDLDVDLLHRGYLKLFKARGGALVNEAAVAALERRGGSWVLSTKQGTWTAPIIVNAAGAWADEIAALAGVPRVGLQPKRRSIGVVPVPDSLNVMALPLVTDMGETWYAKPQSGKLLVSSADATPVEPHDAYADDMAIAEGIERFQQAAEIEVTRLEHSWGGLRTFAPDGNPVVGFDPHTEGFFWLAGQGGYGIQSAPALSRTAAAMVLGNAIPSDVMDAGLDPRDIAPERFR